jgi:hypothetical protein
MNVINRPPDIALFRNPASRKNALVELEKFVNDILKGAFDENSDDQGGQLVNRIEDIIDILNACGYGVFRLNYSGDTRVEASNQQWGQDWDSGLNAGLYLDFGGFSCEVSWHGKT